MNIVNDSSGTDLVSYFTLQLPKDLAAMAALRDELAQRQGAMTAVADANKLKKDAENILAEARQQAENIIAEAKAAFQEQNKKLVELDQQNVLFEQKLQQFEQEKSQFQLQFNAQVALLNEKEKEISKSQEELIKIQKTIDAKTNALLQEKAKFENDKQSFESIVKGFKEKFA